MKQKHVDFFLSSWPHAVVGSALMLLAVAKDEPISMIIGMGSIIVAILNYEERI